MQPLSVKRLVQIPLIAASTVAISDGHVKDAKFDVFKYVDPLIGTLSGGEEQHPYFGPFIDTNLGHVFAGATMPFGMLSGLLSISESS